MSAVTIIQISPHELQAMLDAAVARGVELASKQTGELWGVSQLASHYGCTERTIRRREEDGNIPARSGRQWRKADVLAWDKDRASAR